MTEQTEQVRVRFAPSPTGYLHVGGARTALFNWLFARHSGGKFVLRIEDTDFARSSDEMVEGILRGMRWLGIDWDEGPFYQSRRLDRYREVAAALLADGHAYRCFCPPEKPGGGGLEEGGAGRKNHPQDAGREDAPAHMCALLPPEESSRRAAAGEPFAIRFHIPPDKSSFKDIVFGKIEIDNATLEDFVLLRSDGVPTYHLGVVVDDMDMGITHVIRGADHISNTPKQIFLYRALGRPVPEFAHLPLILGPDKQRLSKRHGATSVMAYAEEGYEPEAFFNFLSLLGWSPGDDRELLSRDELVALFTLEGVGKANAVFGVEKLDWFNGQHLRNMPAGGLRALATAELRKSGVWPAAGDAPMGPAAMDAAIGLVKPRAKKAADFSGNFRAFFTDDFKYDPAAAAKFLGEPKLKDLVPALLGKYEAAPDFTLQSTEEALRAHAEAGGVKAGLLINALRVALTGQGVAPGLFEVMQVLGRRKTLERLRRLCDYLSSAAGK
ncbi:MAG: glutamate--tRNA ligase [Acidobacteriota bacterium]|jgi:glutamyl-tRNA synthetase|nr:glutamate--tRNA ligase [Acidobacteriota bacterium]